MKNLIKAIQKEQKQRLVDFTNEINKVKKHEDLNKWVYNDLLPKGKKLTGTLQENKNYLIERKTKQINKRIKEELTRIKTVFNAPELVNAKISITWNKNRTWGMCPTGEAWIDGQYFIAGGVTGCGYDKLSKILAKLLNQCNNALKPLYVKKDKNVTKTNRELIAYGSGYGILPSFEGGVGIGCYTQIFGKVGYKFETVASGKTFDVFTITKK